MVQIYGENHRLRGEHDIVGAERFEMLTLSEVIIRLASVELFIQAWKYTSSILYKYFSTIFWNNITKQIVKLSPQERHIAAVIWRIASYHEGLLDNPCKPSYFLVKHQDLVIMQRVKMYSFKHDKPNTFWCLREKRWIFSGNMKQSLCFTMHRMFYNINFILQ